MAAKMIASSVTSAAMTHAEFSMDREEVEQFLVELQKEVNETSCKTFHLQIERRSTAPPTGGTASISKGDSVTVSVHKFP